MPKDNIYKVFENLNTAKSYNIINLVSAQSAIPNILFIKALIENGFKIDKCFLIYTKEYEEEKNNIKNFLKNNRIISEEKIDDTIMVDFAGFNFIKEKAKKIINSIEDEDKNSILFNITGGTKIMSCALFNVAKENCLLTNIYYIYDNKIYNLKAGYPSKMSNNLLTIEEYFKITGIEKDKKISFEKIKFNDLELKEKFIDQIQKPEINEKKICYIYKNKLYLVIYINEPTTEKCNCFIYEMNLIQKNTGPFLKGVFIINNGNVSPTLRARARIDDSKIVFKKINNNTDLEKIFDYLNTL